MQEFQSMFLNAKHAFMSIGLSDVLDILIVAFLIYKLLSMVRSTSTARAAKAIVALLLLTWVTDLMQLYVLHFVLSNILSLGFIALVIMFQPELRRALERFGGKSFMDLVGGKSPRSEMTDAIHATVSACEIMSRERVGVLLIFERQASLEEYFKTGTPVDAILSEQLLRNIFFPKAALHDGAVIVREGRVAVAGCVMPLSENPNLHSDLGTRHRAGVGSSEVSDAIAIIVSEETGTISVAIGGMLKRHLAPQTLERLLTNELMPKTEEQQSLWTRTKQFLTKKDRNDAK